jgi:hypothetical protein
MGQGTRRFSYEDNSGKYQHYQDASQDTQKRIADFRYKFVHFQSPYFNRRKRPGNIVYFIDFSKKIQEPWTAPVSINAKSA